MKFGSLSIFASLSVGVLFVVGCGQGEDQANPVRSAQAQSSNYQSSGLVGDEVLKIFSAQCVSCHAGGLGPDLTNFDEIKMKAPAIQNAIISGTMPPNQPLSAEEMAIVVAWAEAGYPLGAAESTGSKDPGSKDPGGKGGKDPGGKGGEKPTPKPPVPPKHEDPGQSDCTSQSKCNDHPDQSHDGVKK